MSEVQEYLPPDIQPTIGRIVYFFMKKDDKEKAALVCNVHSDRLVNLFVYNHDGSGFPFVGATLVQPRDEVPGGGPYCTWMPFQVKKQYGSESGERSAGQQSI